MKPAYNPKRSFILPTGFRLKANSGRVASLMHTESSFERVQQETPSLRKLYEYLNKPILQVVAKAAR